MSPKLKTVKILNIIFYLLINYLFAQTAFQEEQNRFARVRQARVHCEENIDSLFKKIDCKYPPAKIIIVAYKYEQILELWAKPKNSDTFKLVRDYKFTAFSGRLGPKRRRGDLQIPEGFYHINHFNPSSIFHLSMKVNYPNASDRILGYRNNLGDEIRIHGSAVTIGSIQSAMRQSKNFTLSVSIQNRMDRKISRSISFPVEWTATE